MWGLSPLTFQSRGAEGIKYALRLYRTGDTINTSALHNNDWGGHFLLAGIISALDFK